MFFNIVDEYIKEFCIIILSLFLTFQIPIAEEEDMESDETEQIKNIVDIRGRNVG